MAPLPHWLSTLALQSAPSLEPRTISAFEASGNAILQARREAYDQMVRSLAARATTAVKPVNGWKPGQDSKPPTAFNNKAILGLFATLGALMVLASIWFFFFAKNGGFHFEDGDWDDYKSTVLRRKGPDGRTLTNATKSTKLGGSTIVGTQQFKWAKQTAKSVVSYDKKGRKGIAARRGWGKTHSVYYSDDFTDYGDGQTRYQDSRSRSDEMTEVRTMRWPSIRQPSRHHRDRDVQEYKKEKPARVGGLNRIPDGSHIDTTNTDVSDVYSENSDRPILNKKKDKEHDRDRAERRARAEAAKMERRWKREAEEAAAALAQESARSIPMPKKSVSPSKPSGTKQRSSSRSASPKKNRDFSYQSGPESEVLSTAQTGTTSRRTTSYFDEYRPRASDSRGYSSDYTGTSRQNSPTKKGGRDGGYRRGADSDLD